MKDKYKVKNKASLVKEKVNKNWILSYESIVLKAKYLGYINNYLGYIKSHSNKKKKKRDLKIK